MFVQYLQQLHIQCKHQMLTLFEEEYFTWNLCDKWQDGIMLEKYKVA
jgi:hypothetical protein